MTKLESEQFSSFLIRTPILSNLFPISSPPLSQNFKWAPGHLFKEYGLNKLVYLLVFISAVRPMGAWHVFDWQEEGYSDWRTRKQATDGKRFCLDSEFVPRLVMPCLFHTSYRKNSFTGLIYVAQHSLSCYMETLSYRMVVSNNISVPHPKVELKIWTTFVIT